MKLNEISFQSTISSWKFDTDIATIPPTKLTNNVSLYSAEIFQNMLDKWWKLVFFQIELFFESIYRFVRTCRSIALHSARLATKLWLSGWSHDSSSSNSQRIASKYKVNTTKIATYIMLKTQQIIPPINCNRNISNHPLSAFASHGAL